MRMSCALLVVAVMLGFSSGGWTQDRAGGSPSPAASPTANGGDVLWYGKAPPGWGGVVGSMKLLAPGVGWAERGGRLYWTTDNGANWKDITPPLDADEILSSIFFLNPSTGWITTNHTQDPSEATKFALVSTTDAGATWARTTIPLRQQDYGLSTDFPLHRGAGSVVFADPLHGWMNVWFAGETSNTWWSFLLLTSDGGRTWSRAAGAPELRNPQMLLVTSSEGWLYGLDLYAVPSLYVTRDGAHTWQEVELQLPGSDESVVISVPTFEDAKHGFLQVSGVQRKGHELQGTMVLMATSDGGQTWKPDRTVSNLDEITRHQYGLPTVVGSDWIFAASDGHPVLTKVGPGARIDASTGATASRPLYKDIGQISFATPTQAWAIVGDGYLMSTTDGGATWTTLTPGPQPHVIQPHGSFIPRQ